MRKRVTSVQSNAQKWYSEQYNIVENQWKLIYLLPGQCTKDKGLREHQSKILQRYLCLNPLLEKMGLIESDKCMFCKNEKETIPHLFVQCTKVSRFWNNFSSWWVERTGNNVQFDEMHILMGFWVKEEQEHSDLLNMLLLLAKKYLYEVRSSDNVPYFPTYLRKMYMYSEVEKESARRTDRYLDYLQKWEPLLN